jgi:alanine racemase
MVKLVTKGRKIHLREQDPVFSKMYCVCTRDRQKLFLAWQAAFVDICTRSHMYEASQINEWIGLPGSRLANPWMAPAQLLTDSRQLRNAASTLFFCIVSKRNNGHHYLPELYEKGVRNFVVQEMPAEGTFADANLILVKNSIEALQKLATEHRKKFHLPVIGITGSNGKTIIKEWLAQILGGHHRVVRNPGSYNSQTGVPLSVWQLREEHTLALFEAGISHPGEMAQLRSVIRPDITLISNIGKAHLENFSNSRELAKEKVALGEGKSKMVYCRDFPELQELLGHQTDSFVWSRKGQADLIIGKIEKNESQTHIQGIYKNSFISITIPFTDDASIENAIHCWCVLLLLEIPGEIITEGMLQLQPVAMRMHMKEGINGCLLIHDYYNSDPLALHLALQFMAQQKLNRKRTVVLSDVLQSGISSKELYTDIARQLQEAGVEKLIGIGKNISECHELFGMQEKSFFPDTDTCLQQMTAESFWDEVVLLKGARAFTFEKIGNYLQKKSHETVFEISIPALLHNVNYFRSLVPSGTKIMGMVKAFSYGTGSYEIASALEFNQMEYLAVAYADEGVELRKKGIRLPIMVMNPGADSLESLVRWKLEPEVYSMRVLHWMIKTARTHLPLDKKLHIHLKCNTGMNRLGFDSSEMQQVMQLIKESRQLHVVSVFSHLAASENPAFDAFTASQIEKLREVSAFVQQEAGHPVLRHILNTGGIESHPQGIFEMVRLGIGMYGVGFDASSRQSLKPVATLSSCISQIRNIGAEDTVGYGRNGKLPEGGKIAVLPVGYADGYSRRLGNGKGYVMINGKKAPTVGNICMDMLMVDVTQIDCKEGDTVVLIGEGIGLEEMAKLLDTIPYEVLTSVSQRVKRVFIQES